MGEDMVTRQSGLYPLVCPPQGGDFRHDGRIVA
jgi:hypothetical protein